MPGIVWYMFGLIFVTLGLAMLGRRYLVGAVDTERSVWPMWALIAVGLLMLGGQHYLTDLLDVLLRFAKDVVQQLRGGRR